MIKIKKLALIIIPIIFLVSNKVYGFSTKYEKEMYIGCYSNSKLYIGADGAKKYCSCTIDMLSKKYSDEEIDLIFKKKPEEIIKATEFASIHCENNR
tara:strand:+ start:1246 stop:1536 length:291 start_codon:yes stop_codon:yes gene_type:complete